MRNLEVEMPAVGAFGFYDFMSVAEVLDTMIETIENPLLYISSDTPVIKNNVYSI